jgi:hypothetical protein
MTPFLRYNEVSLNSLMELIHDVLIVECCERTKQTILRPVTHDNNENFAIFRQDVLRCLFDNPALESTNFVHIADLQSLYENL